MSGRYTLSRREAEALTAKLGVPVDSLADNVRAELTQLGIPQEAVTIEQTLGKVLYLLGGLRPRKRRKKFATG